MKRTLCLFLLVLAAFAIAIPAAAQPSTRVPVVLDGADINDAADAHPFGFDASFIVTDVDDADLETSEPQHSCAPGAHTESIWFITSIGPGTVTLNTSGSSYTVSGGSSSNTVISLYRLNNSQFFSFSDLSPVTCNDNGTGVGIINSVQITQRSLYMIQISAAPGVAVTGASTVNLTATFAPTVPHPFDHPQNAKTLKIPSMPAIINPQDATIALDEPVDPLLTQPITNSTWFKFTYADRRIFNALSFTDGNPLWFSLFQFNGTSYVPAATVYISSSQDYFEAVLDPGTYYLRVAVTDTGTGAFSAFSTFIAPAYFAPGAFQFSVPGTEGEIGASPSTDGWKLKKATAGPGGDEAICENSGSYRCYFHLVSSGATEATTLQAKLDLGTSKIKKGDVVTIQVVTLSNVGTPNFVATLTLTSATGVSQVYTMKVTELSDFNQIVMPVHSSMTAVKSVLKVKNKDTVGGNSIDLNTVIGAALRVGEGVVRDGATLKLPLGGEIPLSWATGRSVKGVLPAPPPAQ